jgi:DNA-directed RNA polymerase subunit M/transcription elongation factor TFIIS
MYRTHTSAEDQCPRCAHLLEVNPTEESVMTCKHCGGCFVTSEVASRVATAFDAALARVDLSAALGRTEKVDFNPAVDINLACPKCQREMQRTYVASALSYVDTCVLHGTWFDAEEMSRVGRALRTARRKSLATNPIGLAPPVEPMVRSAAGTAPTVTASALASDSWSEFSRALARSILGN